MLNEKGGFVRPCLVSTDEQKKFGYSVGSQIEALEKYCSDNHYIVVDIYNDEGISAHKTYLKRPNLLRLLDDVRAGKIDIILFCKLDRWTRDPRYYYQVQDILDQYNVPWKAILEDYDTSTTDGRLKLNLMLSIAEQEASRTSDRIKFVFDGKKQRGEYVGGRLPLGYKVVDKHVVPDEEKVPLVREIFQKYIDLRSVRGVSHFLMDTYQIQLSNNATRQLLSNAKYKGVDGFCDGIIDPATFDKVQDILEMRASRTKSKSVPNGDNYIFGGMLICSVCGLRMFGKTYGNSVHYHCGGHMKYGNSRCDHDRGVRQDYIENWLLQCVVSEAEKYNIQIEAKSKSAPQVDKAAIKRKLEKLKDLYINDLIDKDMYIKDYEDLSKKLADAEKPIIDKKIDVDKISSVIKVYDKLNPKSKKAFWSRTISRIEVNKSNDLAVFWQSPN